MKLKRLLIIITGVIICSLSSATQAYTLDKLGDNNFNKLLHEDVSQWLCSVSNDTTGNIELCAADTDYTAADPGGVTIGTTGRRTVLSQVTASLDNTTNLPVIRLAFDYRLSGQTDSTAANFNVNIVGSDYETHSLFSTAVNRASAWRHAVVDVWPYAAGNPSVEFELDNGSGSSASVSIRRVHLYVRSYATLQATFQNQVGNPLARGRLTVQSRSGAMIRSQKLDAHGQIAILEIPGNRQSYRIRLSYQGRHYYTWQRFRYGDDFNYTWQVKRASHSLQLVE